MKTYEMKVGLGGIVRSFRNANLKFPKALMEIVDNSVDSNSTVVRISEINGDLVVTDNGDGIKDFTRVLTIGDSDKKGRDNIGRYGVGMKHACARYSNITTIASGGKAVVVPWAEIANERCDGVLGEIRAEYVKGVTVRLHDFRDYYSQKIPTNTIAKAYDPLLDGSLHIYLNGELVKQLPKPSFYQRIDKHFDWKGKRVRIVGGIYETSDPSAQQWKGYQLYYNGRLIGDGNITSMGIGNEACTNYCFHVHLTDGYNKWDLATNKDSLTSAKELLSYCYDKHTKPLIKEAAEHCQDIEIEEVVEDVNAMLSGSGNITRRGSAGKKGTVKPSQSGPRKVKTNTANSIGEYQDSGKQANTKRHRSFQFNFTTLHNGSLGAVCNLGAKLLVQANLGHPFWQAHKADRHLILLFCQLSHASYRRTQEEDVNIDEFLFRIMSRAGADLSHCLRHETPSN